MNNFRIEENLNRVRLVFKTIKYNIIVDRDMKAKHIKYGKDIKQYYRLYNEKNNDKPVIFFIHGGGWWHGSPKMCTCIGKYFAKLGYTVVLPAYRLTPLHKYPSQIEDIYSAFSSYSKRNMHYRDRKFIIMGFSAGGELAANLIFNRKMQEKYKINSSILKGLITFSGVLNFEKCTSKHSKRLIKNYLGENTNINNANPINLISKDTKVPVLCIHGDRDPLINKENSSSFINKINSMNKLARLEIVKGKHHSDINELIIGKGEQMSKIILEFINTL
ncbi:alpha/beta hydrolase [Clostridium gasigenes]|uniref:alpha/beta hydrolase n=1 Tax=Clostridium gasigenes TaxID=94869 RepID=UPI0014383862|nr:alpha/beta hydrolase [Clostridium gasigenes]NKF07401.1 alpha/beta hydrolase [Clostridium gasigenes]QSW18366.1 alpha/beta hydrolase [Clostridium gasigenes]